MVPSYSSGDLSPQAPCWVSAPHPREFDRLLSICGLGALQPGREPLFDEVAGQAAELCGAPTGLVSLVRERDQVFIGRLGTQVEDTARDQAFCAQTILQSDPLVVEDARLNPLFAHLALVTEPPFVRFYAGAPILDRNGLPLGSVCVLDTTPRELSSKNLIALQRLAAMVSVVLEARRVVVGALGASQLPTEIRTALDRLDLALVPLFDRSNGFRRSLT